MSANETNSAAVIEAVDAAANLAQIFLPQFAAYILLGKTLAKAAPELYADAVKLVSVEEPTEAEKADLARKLELLANPEKA